MSGFKNLYALLGISPLAGSEQIRAALSQAAQNNKISLVDAQLVQQFLLNEETRRKYNAKLFAEYPEVLQQMIDEKIKVQVNKVQHNDEKITVKEVKLNKKHEFKKYLLLAVILLAVGIIPFYFFYIKPHMLFSKAEESVKLLLKDPDSAKFAKEKINIVDGDRFVCGMVNAKNSMGGYDGYNYFIYSYDNDKNDLVIIPSDKPKEEDKVIYYSIIWQNACNGMSKEKVKEWVTKADKIREEINRAQDKLYALGEVPDVEDDNGVLDGLRQREATEKEAVNKVKGKLDEHIKRISIYEKTTSSSQLQRTFY